MSMKASGLALPQFALANGLPVDATPGNDPWIRNQRKQLPIKILTQRNTQAQVVVLTNEPLKKISAGVDVIEPGPGEPPEDDSWWIKKHLPGLHG